ncbi:MAG: stage 0 sporulation family protein [Clostridiales Family XIII bacterium]|jgi:cell fate regulator YaaT (PSP1 superfamily)|nr:stage 0 sporulation family protein [Clostridiales Family XIII bacterium]
MIKVAGVCFRKAGKVYHFDPGDIEVACGDNVIAETARGLEFGTVRCGVRDIPESDITLPLKKIVRIANDEDLKQHEENLKKKEKALELCREKIVGHKLEMKFIDVEYIFDNSKVIFYFTADGRVDFRELVKDLAGVFKARIELRQVGVRDEAKMLGGMGICGRSLCCHSWMPEFEPVSIKMAKVQNLSLNPIKISGTCGRLMCCLKYENETYHELKKGMPNVGERVETPDGTAVVTDTNVLMGQVKARLILEEKTGETSEKFSAELNTYHKDDVKRLLNQKKKKSETDDGTVAEALPDEFEKLSDE